MFHYKCDTCPYVRDMLFVPRDYVFPDGRLMWMIQRHCWCVNCNTITVAEMLEEDAESNRSRLERRSEHRKELESGSVRSEVHAELLQKWIRNCEAYDRDLADFKALRTKPQFCLKCGNEDVFVSADLLANLPHLTCGGTLICTASVSGGTYLEPVAHRYSIDGKLLELGYWRSRFASDVPKPLELWWQESQGDGDIS